MKLTSRILLLLAIAGLLALPIMAQDTSKSQNQPPAKKAAPAKAEPMGMPMPKPAPEMIKLAKSLAGTWTIKEQFEPGPMAPKGGTGQGTAKIWSGPGGLSLMENYRSSSAMGKFSGAGIFWWDAKAQAYRGVWCDNGTPSGCDASAQSKWEGDKLVGTMESEMNGQKMAVRMVYSDFKPDSFVMTMEMGPDANSLKKMMTITYTKAPAAGQEEKPAAK